MLRRGAHQGGIAERNAVIDTTQALSISRQAQLAGSSRGRVYDVPVAGGEADLVLMRLMDARHLEHPFMGARLLRNQLNREGYTVGRTHVRPLMVRMGLAAVYRKPNARTRCPGQPVQPYLLRGLTIKRANQVWALDTTYSPMANGVVDLPAVVDWASRKVLASTVALTGETGHAVAVRQDAVTRHGAPEIVHTDHGRQFTAPACVPTVTDRGCHLSMDGCGAWRDNVFIERRWNSVQDERGYLPAYASVTEARPSILEYLDCDTQARPHASLDLQTPDEAYAVMRPTGNLAA